MRRHARLAAGNQIPIQIRLHQVLAVLTVDSVPETPQQGLEFPDGLGLTPPGFLVVDVAITQSLPGYADDVARHPQIAIQFQKLGGHEPLDVALVLGSEELGAPTTRIVEPLHIHTLAVFPASLPNLPHARIVPRPIRPVKSPQAKIPV